MCEMPIKIILFKALMGKQKNAGKGSLWIEAPEVTGFLFLVAFICFGALAPPFCGSLL